MVRTVSMVPFLGFACSFASVDVPYDEDGDGLMSEEEDEYGTDPQKADSDGDEYSDGEEVVGNTDPNDRKDHPYEGGWAIDSCRHDIDGTGTAVGEIANNFELEDQFGDTVRLHDFCGKAILLTIGAEWCVPCQMKAAKLEALYQQYEPEGFIAIDVLFEDQDYEPATSETAERWVDAYGLTVPVLIDPDGTLLTAYAAAGLIPSETLMAAGLEILVADTQDADTFIDTAL
jgi:peroxiredoxin